MTSKVLAVVLLLTSFGFAQFAGDPGVGDSGGAAGCTPIIPSVTDAYQAYNASNVCTGGCTGSGHNVTSVADSIGAVTFTNLSTAPTFTSGAVNGQPSFTFNGSAGLTATATFSNIVTFYAIVKPTACSGDQTIIGTGTGGPWFQWRVDASCHQELLVQSTVSLKVGTATLSTSSYNAIALVYNQSTGAGQLYVCSGGTCSADGTAISSVSSPSAPTTVQVGTRSSGTESFTGDIVDWGIKTSVDTSAVTAFGTYANCKYGI